MDNATILEKLINSTSDEIVNTIKEYELHKSESFLRCLGREFNYLANITNRQEKQQKRLDKVYEIANIYNSKFLQ